jgi:dipeptidyl aminopeptidase/acylaminoacyl peptidase
MAIVHLLALLTCVAVAVGCGAGDPDPTVAPQSTATSTLTATVTAAPRSTATQTLTPTATATRTSAPTATQTSTPTRTATPTPNPLEPYTVLGMRERAYPGGEIAIQWTYTRTNAYTRHYVTYPSDELTISGVLCVPHGDGPFPVVILNHGYIAPDEYWSGADTWYASAHLARAGYLTISPDFRGWGESDSGPNYFRTGLTIDALNLISALPSLVAADPERVGMWGHSMGGGVATRSIVIDKRVKAAVLYGPVSADDLEYGRRWRFRVSPLNSDPLQNAYRRARYDRAFLARTSPINHFDLASAPVQIHVGESDSVTPPRWAEAIRDALLAEGVEIEYYTYPGQGHAFHGASWDLFMERVVRFYDQHLKGCSSAGCP